MLTRSSKSPSNSENEDLPITTGSKVKEHASWTIEDEAKLLAFLLNALTEGKASLGDNQMFKTQTFQEAADVLNTSITKGALKTMNSVKSKWSRVCLFLLLRYII
jgi:hypothetical protein